MNETKITTPREHVLRERSKRRPVTRARAYAVRRLQRVSLASSEWAVRMFEVTAASLLLLAASPLFVTRALWAVVDSGRVFAGEELLGAERRPVTALRFAGRGPFRALPALVDVVLGRAALVGPRALRRSAGSVGAREAIRFAVRPGLVSPHRIQSWMGIAYESEFESDRDYVLRQSLRSDLAIAARAVPAFVVRRESSELEGEVRMLGVKIDNLTIEQSIGRLVTAAREGSALRAAFVNPDCLNKSYTDAPYRSALNSSDVVFADGIGLQVAGRILRAPLAANVNGTDLFPRLCHEAAREGLSIFLLGARPGVAAAAAETMRARFPDLKVAGTRDGYWTDDEQSSVIADVRASGADILLVALGAPRQELWLERHHLSLGVPVVAGVGGLFDFYSGRIPRAPLWLREIGLEWTWRLAQEPGRMWRRYVLGNPLFLFRVGRQAIGKLPVALEGYPTLENMS